MLRLNDNGEIEMVEETVTVLNPAQIENRIASLTGEIEQRNLQFNESLAQLQAEKASQEALLSEINSVLSQ